MRPMDGKSYLELENEASRMSLIEVGVLCCCLLIAVEDIIAFYKAPSTHLGIRGSRP
jgi:hypothetical protein